MYIDYLDIDENVNTYQKVEKIVAAIKERFVSYGYERIKTPTFERYDLYLEVNSSIPKREMIKVIDQTGDVLVLRPDVTIPITRSLVEQKEDRNKEYRYFYVQDVFRQARDEGEPIDHLQAGIEYFGNHSKEADAEVIALANHLLTDLKLKDITLEIGHAGFFQEVIDQLDLTEQALRELKQMIQAKNVVDLRTFLVENKVNREIAQLIERIPFLYGHPMEVIKRAKKLYLTDRLSETLDYLIEVYEILKIYGLEDRIVLDLGLINYMGYYSGVIFQGFVENVGKPVLMGGRYDRLSEVFGGEIPAVGFACEIDLLASAVEENGLKDGEQANVFLIYESDQMADAIQLASKLRGEGLKVVSSPKSDQMKTSQHHCVIEIGNNRKKIEVDGTKQEFQTFEDVLTVIKGGR